MSINEYRGIFESNVILGNDNDLIHVVTKTGGKLGDCPRGCLEGLRLGRCGGARRHAQAGRCGQRVAERELRARP